MDFFYNKPLRTVNTVVDVAHYGTDLNMYYNHEVYEQILFSAVVQY